MIVERTRNMMREIDHTLAPTKEELLKALNNTPISVLDIAEQATETACEVWRPPQSAGDVAWIATYALTAGYILGVRNERKRRRRSGRK